MPMLRDPCSFGNVAVRPATSGNSGKSRFTTSAGIVFEEKNVRLEGLTAIYSLFFL
jgi:hypothetical protein